IRRFYWSSGLHGDNRLCSTKAFPSRPYFFRDAQASMAITPFPSTKLFRSLELRQLALECPWRSPPWLHQSDVYGSGEGAKYQVSMAITAVAASKEHARVCKDERRIACPWRSPPWLHQRGTMLYAASTVTIT